VVGLLVVVVRVVGVLLTVLEVVVVGVFGDVVLLAERGVLGLLEAGVVGFV